MGEFITAINDSAFSLVTTGMLSWLLVEVKRVSKDSKIRGKAVKSLLFDKLRYFHNKYVKDGDGTISEYDFEVISDIYHQYSELNGNGRGKKYFEDISDLEVTRGG